MAESAILLIHCPDRKGIVHALSGFLSTHGGNILHSDQHQDDDLGLFFMRIEWDLAGFTLEDHTAFQHEFTPLAGQFQMNWRLAYSTRKPAIAIFVSSYEHCLMDLLYRRQVGELPCDIKLVISNHATAQRLATFYHVPFHHIPVTAATRLQAEQSQLELLDHHHIDLVVLARYMQVLSPAFVRHYPERIVNVHHSFLPAFSGARPYQAAFQRGVKLIGATSHYVTDVLDEGPIIEQDVVRISHRDQVSQLMEKGRDLERVVLSRAVRWHLEHRILCYANKTVVFD